MFVQFLDHATDCGTDGSINEGSSSLGSVVGTVAARKYVGSLLSTANSSPNDSNSRGNQYTSHGTHCYC